MIKVGFSFKSQGTEKFELFSHGTNDSINLTYESLITVDFKFQSFQLWLKEDDN